MSSDPNKKSTRSFQCRDVLWETFEQMARELECSVDYLINEAMKQYARQRSYGPGATKTPYPGRLPEPSLSGSSPAYGPPPQPQGNSMPTPAVPGPPQMRAPGPLPPPPGRGRSSSGLPPPPGHNQGRVSAPPSPPMMRGGGLPPPPGFGGGMSPSRPPPPPQHMMQQQQIPQAPRSVPPPIPGGGQRPMQQGYNGYGASPSGAPSAGVLSVIYSGEKIPVNKERFVIGRGKQSSDLTLKDPNVSRQHAMVEFQNGVYFMVDMGSTNGVEYNGQRIARKQIAEGDAFRICDHEVRFTYR
jgi:pSer/pThr/pTyr-binding forkhead associated (FHA) protein